MGVAACLRWEVRMTQNTSTHRHDFRWPTADCLVPRAEAPNNKCVTPPPTDDSGRMRPWCGRDKPLAPVPGPLEAQPRVCYDLASAQGDSAKPWCERGLLVDMISPRTGTAPPAVRTAPTGCEPEASDRPWCEGDAPPRPVAARVGAAPQQDISRYDQPNQYLRKLCDKFPEPVSVVTKPRDELMRRVYADRYRTTYQTDYCRNLDDIARMISECDSHDPSNYKQQQEARVGYTQQTPAPAPEACKCCGCVCKTTARSTQLQAAEEPGVNPLACRAAAVSKNFHFSCCNTKKSTSNKSNEQVGPPEKIPPWISEYTDFIGKTGQMIMDHKLLYPKKEKKYKL